MMSFRAALILFLIGGIGLGLAIFSDLSKEVTLASAGIGLGSWFAFAIWNFIDRGFRMGHHLKQSWAIEKDLKAEKVLEAEQTVQRGKSKAAQRAASRRVKLWIDTILGAR